MLQDEIDSAQRLVKTDAYQMSVGEIVNMYKDGELIINPDFQRLFRWEPGQKSKLIESILLGIPIPSIFVYERENSTWELIDGLQRVSTILEFMGLLKEPNSETLLPPSYLTGTKYLPSLANIVWERDKRITDIHPRSQIAIDKSLQLTIRRARLSVEILKRPSDSQTKYDLFQRLNAGGTPANAQELRNCIVIMINEKYFKFLKTLSDYEPFRIVIAASEDQIEQQRHMEYASRFLVYTYIDYDSKFDVEDYINEGMIKLAEKHYMSEPERCFKQTFELLNNCFGANALRRISNGHHQGRVSLGAFECIAVGVARNIKEISQQPHADQFINRRIKQFWRSKDLSALFAPGLRGTIRIQRTIPFGSQMFRP
ncbi:MAG TPA: DUF262 domain-containing protein [Methylocella sp.]|nr:DUF262 domain-containing protein [Methylocella sp.]